MITITNSKGENQEYNSLANACNMNGATSGMNRKAMLNFLTKSGFDIDTLVEGTYRVTITDAEQCSTTALTVLSEPNPPSINLY